MRNGDSEELKPRVTIFNTNCGHMLSSDPGNKRKVDKKDMFDEHSDMMRKGVFVIVVNDTQLQFIFKEQM